MMYHKPFKSVFCLIQIFSTMLKLLGFYWFIGEQCFTGPQKCPLFLHDMMIMH